MNVSSLMTAHDRFLGVQQSPPLAALHHMMETKIPRGPTPPVAALPPPPRSSRSCQPHHHSSLLSSSSSTPHRIHNILGRVPSSLQFSPDVAAGFAAAAAAAAGLVVDPGVCPGYSAVPPPRAACSVARTSCGPAASSFWSNQTAVKSAVSPITDWNHTVAGVYICVGCFLNSNSLSRLYYRFPPRFKFRLNTSGFKCHALTRSGW